jgi:hypothetical protein
LNVNLKIEEIKEVGYPILEYTSWRLQNDPNPGNEKKDDEET